MSSTPKNACRETTRFTGVLNPTGPAGHASVPLTAALAGRCSCGGMGCVTPGGTVHWRGRGAGMARAWRGHVLFSQGMGSPLPPLHGHGTSTSFGKISVRHFQRGVERCPLPTHGRRPGDPRGSGGTAQAPKAPGLPRVPGGGGGRNGSKFGLQVGGVQARPNYYIFSGGAPPLGKDVYGERP
eukprot:gene22175-biopygen14745